MPDIFSFVDYRKFISAWYAEKKHSRPKVTYRVIAHALGFNSPAHVMMVLKNKANLSRERALKMAGLMGLNKKDTTYFLLMVDYNQHRAMKDKQRFLSKMVRLNKRGTVLLKPDQYEYYRKWYYSVIHDILSFYPFRGDFDALAKMVQPPITRREAQKAVALLERMQFILKNDHGEYRCEYPAISAYAEGGSLMLSSYAEAMMERARHALNKFPAHERSISWAGFSMSKETFEKVKEEARQFRKRLIAMAQADTSAHRAYFLAMQIFPVSKQWESQSEESGSL